MESPPKAPMPKKYCMITLMFPIEDSKKAIEIKSVIDEAVKDIEDKRFRFEINES